jgi:hypothetical protein
MKMYGITVDAHFSLLQSLSSQLEMLVRQIELTPTSSLLMEAELAAACGQDHLRDMTLWLRACREAVDQNQLPATMPAAAKPTALIPEAISARYI